MKSYSIRPTERVDEMLKYIKTHQGLKTMSATIEYSIGVTFLKLNPTRNQMRGFGDDDPDEAARRKLAAEEAQKSERMRLAEAKATQLCTALLKGKVVEKESGKTCVFYTYNFDTKDEQVVPLDMVTSDFAKYQNVTAPKKIKK